MFTLFCTQYVIIIKSGSDVYKLNFNNNRKIIRINCKKFSAVTLLKKLLTNLIYFALSSLFKIEPISGINKPIDLFTNLPNL